MATGGGQFTAMFSAIYAAESLSRNADFILIARRAIHNPQRRSRCQTSEPSEPSEPFPAVLLCLIVSPTGTSSRIILFQLVPTCSSLFHRNEFSPAVYHGVVPACSISFHFLFHLISQSPSEKTGQWNKWNKKISIEMYKRKEGCKWHMYDIYIRARGACSPGRCF